MLAMGLGQFYTFTQRRKQYDRKTSTVIISCVLGDTLKSNDESKLL